jgi:peptide-methionine (S)-S-oxide reductase
VRWRYRSAEAIRIGFDPAQLSYGDLLDIFFATHDPTQLNRQGKRCRHAVPLRDLSGVAGAGAGGARGIERRQADQAKRIVTTIEPWSRWWPAETYHQDYWETSGRSNPYCMAVIPPKLQKLRKSFAARAKSMANA